MSYYIDLDGSTAGPFTIDQLAQLYRHGSVTDKTLYACPNSQEWLPVRTILPLFSPQPSSAPPPVIPSPAPAPAPRAAGPFCPGCGYVGTMRTRTKGSFAVEIALYLLFCLPGIIYTLWRITSGKETRCPSCGATI
jgi:hypothetical protein